MTQLNKTKQTSLFSRLSFHLGDLIAALVDAELTYQGIADQLDVSLDTIKNIATNRTNQPRIQTLRKIHNKLRQVRFQNYSSAVNAIIDNILSKQEVTAATPPLGFLHQMLGIDVGEHFKGNKKIAGVYECFSHSHNTDTILRAKLQIFEYEETIKTYRFHYEHLSAIGRQIIFQGYVLHSLDYISLYGAQQGGEGLLTISWDASFNYNNSVSYGLKQLQPKSRPAFAARVLARPLSGGRYRDAIDKFNHIETPVAKNLLNEIEMGMISNSSVQNLPLQAFADY